MLDIERLEKRWKIYKLKSSIPHIIIFCIAGAVLIFSSFFVDNKKPTPTPIIKELKKEIPKPIQEIKKPEPIKIEKVKEITQKKLLISPSFEFLENIETKVMVAKKKVVVIKKEKVKVRKIEKKSIVIERKNNYKDIADVIKRFKKNNNPALSLFVAKKYYEIGEYKRAYNYALITNNINDKIELSWIIFAKSLVKLNKKAKAKKILKEYINDSNSNSAKILLEDIEKGRL